LLFGAPVLLFGAPVLLSGDADGGGSNGGSEGILTPSKRRNIFCLNEAFRPFLTRFFTLLLGVLRDR
jgi:hypothetical protein